MPAPRGEDRIGTGRLRVIACGMIAREAIAVRDLCGLAHVEVTALPARWHFEPDRIVEGVRQAIADARAEGVTDIFVGYGDCGTGGGVAALCDALGVAWLESPHCFATYLDRGPEETDEHDLAAFYVTDFLARQPDAFLWRPLGLDRHPELAADYFGHYERVRHLAQTDDPALDASAREIADRLGLRYERTATGYGALLSLVARWAGKAREGSLAASGDRA